MTGRIVVAVRGGDDDSRDALALAVVLARPTRSELVLAGVWSAPLGPLTLDFEHAVHADMTRQIGAALMPGVPAELAVRVHARGAASIVGGLHEIVEREDATTLVIGPSHLSGTARAVRGDIALGAIRDAPCAVAVAPRGYRLTAAPPRRIVVGWDGSDESVQALERATDLAVATEGELRVLHVVELPDDPAVTDRALIRGRLDDLTFAAQALLDDARRRVAGRVPVRCEVAEGRPGPELAAFAHGAGLVVTGSRRYGPLRRLVLGSSSAELLRDTPAAVLVLPRGVAARPEPPPDRVGEHAAAETSR